ncbi:MAG: threonine synthase, partial [Bdellovibrionota bacterium]
MKFVSTRGKAPAVSFTEAMNTGLAPDGGLYVPENFPLGDNSYLDPTGSFPKFAAEVVGPYLEGDAIEKRKAEICQAAFDFPIPLRVRKDGTGILELFHGPTSAFKDVGARFLAECLSNEPHRAKRTVLVATSGDTG